jgi:hypothetical protein
MPFTNGAQALNTQQAILRCELLFAVELKATAV